MPVSSLNETDSSVVSHVKSLSGTREYRKRNADDVVTSFQGSSKRRRRNTLNAQFDRMASTIQASLCRKDNSPDVRRESSSIRTSSSASSYNPSTLFSAAYMQTDRNIITPNFAVIKDPTPISSRRLPPSGEDIDSNRQHAENQPQGTTAPMWLQNAVASLSKNHPLRSFIPVHHYHSSPQQQIPSVPPVSTEQEDEIFAFRPPTSQDHTYAAPDELHSTQRDSSGSDVHFDLAYQDYPLLPLPFSTPGPASDLAPISWDGRPDIAGGGSDVEKVAASSVADDAGFWKMPSSPLVPAGEEGCKSDTWASFADEQEMPAMLDFHAELAPGNIRSSSPDDTSYESSAMYAPGLSPSHSLSPRSSDSIPTSKPFATPGPGSAVSSTASSRHLAAPRFHVYFDSPAEDPIHSDPIEKPDYEMNLDYGALDFKWEKFDRSGLSLGESSSPYHSLAASELQEDLEEVQADYMPLSQAASDVLEDSHENPLQDLQSSAVASEATPANIPSSQPGGSQPQIPDGNQASQPSSDAFAGASRSRIKFPPPRELRPEDEDHALPFASKTEDRGDSVDEVSADDDAGVFEGALEASLEESDARVCEFPLTTWTAFKTPSPQHGPDAVHQDDAAETENDPITSTSSDVSCSQSSRDTIESWTAAAA
ncbi:hypothetical protein EIP91_004477 [Steccherinum ochraceum]|uniref:Uncharacterized protein n=1 Tax=Steccherinum ochraceum TaxID=92696 RepID=A0A4R0RP59_9APHY|nr:hypothetical protein EIP91_004477 [Steccherinum ochraceum]